MSYPTDRRFTPEHEWVVLDGDVATVGVTAFATEALGDVVYVDLPEVGTEVVAGATCGEIESTKSVSDLYSPVSGTVASINEELADLAEVVGADPYGAGWLFTVTVTEIGPTLDAADYAATLEE